MKNSGLYVCTRHTEKQPGVKSSGKNKCILHSQEHCYKLRFSPKQKLKYFCLYLQVTAFNVCN